MQIFYSPEFCRRYKRLSVQIREQTKEKEKVFRENPFDHRLKTHKLHGKFYEYWAFSVDFDCRIVFKFHDKNTIRFYSIGGHSIYK